MQNLTFENLVISLNYFKNSGVSHDKNLEEILLYQDMMGNATIDQIKKVFKKLDRSEKRTFHWVNFLTLSQDTALDLIRDLVVLPEADKVFNEKFDEATKDFNQTIIEKDQELAIDADEIKRLEEAIDHHLETINIQGATVKAQTKKIEELESKLLDKEMEISEDNEDMKELNKKIKAQSTIIKTQNTAFKLLETRFNKIAELATL